MSNPRRPRPSEVVGALNRAADFIETHPWTAGNFDHYEDTKVNPDCAVTALNKVTRFAYWEACNVLDSQVCNDYGGRFREIVDFNDAQRDKRKVVRLFRRAARNLARHGWTLDPERGVILNTGGNK